KNPTRHKMKTKSIESAFIGEGYVSMPFLFNGAGHPMINVTIADNVQTNILLDTGASANLLDYDFARSLGLKLTLLEEKGGGAGGHEGSAYFKWSRGGFPGNFRFWILQDDKMLY